MAEHSQDGFDPETRQRVILLWLLTPEEASSIPVDESSRATALLEWERVSLVPKVVPPPCSVVPIAMGREPCVYVRTVRRAPLQSLGRRGVARGAIILR